MSDAFEVAPLTTLSGTAALLALDNVNTDMIVPKQFLVGFEPPELAGALFYDLRYANKQERPEFILNQPPWRDARVVVSGANFGCGSSREHAAWALRAFGIRCVAAASFGEIFEMNCFKNGIAPICLAPDGLARTGAAAQAGMRIEIDLEQCLVNIAGEATIPFAIDPFGRACLVAGSSERQMVLSRMAKVADYEASRSLPWLPDFPTMR